MFLETGEGDDQGVEPEKEAGENGGFGGHGPQHGQPTRREQTLKRRVAEDSEGGTFWMRYLRGGRYLMEVPDGRRYYVVG